MSAAHSFSPDPAPPLGADARPASSARPFPLGPVRPSGGRPAAARGGPRDQRRADAVDRLLTALEDLVRRHRALSTEGSHRDLHAELVAAEVAHELAITRSALLRHPPLRSPA